MIIYNPEIYCDMLWTLGQLTSRSEFGDYKKGRQGPEFKTLKFRGCMIFVWKDYYLEHLWLWTSRLKNVNYKIKKIMNSSIII